MKPTYEELLSQRDYFKNRMDDLRDIIDKMQPERDWLASQVEVLKNIRNDWQGLAVNDAKTLIAFIRAVDATPTACLAQVKAEAGRAGFIAGYHKMHIEFVGSIAPAGSAEHAADQYADRIKQGNKP
jgi:hypothetical protein